MVNKNDGQGQGTETEVTAWCAASQRLTIWSRLKASSKSRLYFPDICCPSTNNSAKEDWPLQFLNGKCARRTAGSLFICFFCARLCFNLMQEAEHATRANRAGADVSRSDIVSACRSPRSKPLTQKRLSSEFGFKMSWGLEGVESRFLRYWGGAEGELHWRRWTVVYSPHYI